MSSVNNIVQNQGYMANAIDLVANIGQDFRDLFGKETDSKIRSVAGLRIASAFLVTASVITATVLAFVFIPKIALIVTGLFVTTFLLAIAFDLYKMSQNSQAIFEQHKDQIDENDSYYRALKNVVYNDNEIHFALNLKEKDIVTDPQLDSDKIKAYRIAQGTIFAPIWSCLYKFIFSKMEGPN